MADGTLVANASANTDEFRSAKVEEFEFRTETKDFDLAQQEYTIRVSPSTKAIRKAEEELYKAYTSKPSDTDAELQYKFIEDAYYFWVNEFISEEKQELYQEWDLILKDKKSVVEKQLVNNDFDLADYFEVNNEMKDLELKKIGNAGGSNLFQSPFQIANVVFDFEDIISLSSIESFAKIYDPSQITTTLKNEEYSYEKYLIQKELDLEVAQTKQILKFGQVAFNGPNSDPFKEKFSIGAAFRFPWDGGNRLKIYELKHKLENVDFTENSELKQIYVSGSRARYDLLNLIEKYKELEDLRVEQNKDSQKFIEVIAKSQGFNPIHALEVKEQTMKSKLESLDMLQDIYESYIKLLKDSQLMFASPNNNYLLD